MLSVTSSSPPTCPKNGDEEAERRKTRVKRGKERARKGKEEDQ
jgi:hypothetical protein